jgi:acetolactate synthase small subunit
MGHLSIEFVKRHCVLVLKIEMPLQTMERLMDFFAARKIIVDSMHMQAIEGGEAHLMIYCLIEKDRISHTRSMLEKMRGVLELQLLENKVTNMAGK